MEDLKIKIKCHFCPKKIATNYFIDTAGSYEALCKTCYKFTLHQFKPEYWIEISETEYKLTKIL